MTCIIGIKQPSKGRVLMMADTCEAFAYEYAPGQANKLFMRRDVIFGGSGDGRASEILQHELDFAPPEDYHGEPDAYAYQIANAIMELHAQRYHAQESENRRRSDAAFLVAFGPHLYVIAGDYSVSRVDEPAYALGSGGAFARGALALLCAGDNYKPMRVGKTAMSVAAQYSMGVRPPYTALWTTPIGG